MGRDSQLGAVRLRAGLSARVFTSCSAGGAAVETAPTLNHPDVDSADSGHPMRNDGLPKVITIV